MFFLHQQSLLIINIMKTQVLSILFPSNQVLRNGHFCDSIGGSLRVAFLVAFDFLAQMLETRSRPLSSNCQPFLRQNSRTIPLASKILYWETLTAWNSVLPFTAQWSDGRPVPVGTLADDDEVASTHILPDKADMFLAYATVPGYRYISSLLKITEFKCSSFYSF